MALINNKTSTKEALKRVKSLVVNGWAFKTYRVNGCTTDYGYETVKNPGGACYCLMGAVNEAAGLYDGGSGLHNSNRVYDRVTSALAAQVPKKFKGNDNVRYDVIDFNDAPGRKKREVIELIDRAIEAA